MFTSPKLSREIAFVVVTPFTVKTSEPAAELVKVTDAVPTDVFAANCVVS